LRSIPDRQNQKPAIHGRTFYVLRLTLKKLMNQPHATFDYGQRRAGIRRTVWIVGGLALAMFVLFFLKQGIWH